MSKMSDWLASLSEEDCDYVLKYLPSHMAEASDGKKLFRFLTDFDFIAAKIAHPQLQSHDLIEDYDRAFESKVGMSEEKAKTLKLIQGAIRLSAHILDQDKTQLAGQLWGRLMAFDVPEIQGMLEQVQRSKTTWLRPLTASLNRPDGRLLRTFTGHSNSINAVAVTPDGKWVISGSSDKTLKVWNLETGKEERTLTGHSNSVNAVTVTPDGKRVISGSSDKTLKVWNLETGKEERTLTGHNDSVNSVTVTPDGKWVISGSNDNSIRVWNWATGEKKLALINYNKSVNAVSVSTDGKWVISGSETRFPGSLRNGVPSESFGKLSFWNLETGVEKFDLCGHNDSVNAVVAVSTDRLRVISGSSDNTLIIWNLDIGKKQGLAKVVKKLLQTLRIPYPETEEPEINIQSSSLPTSHKASVSSVAVTPDGLKVISGSSDKTLKIFNLETKQELFTLTDHSDSVNAVAITPDGLRVISGSSDKTLKIWNLETEKEPFTLTSQRDSIEATVASLDGNPLISGSNNKTFNISNRPFFPIAHSDSVNALAVTPDGAYVISGSSDKTLKVWNLQTGKEMSTLTSRSTWLEALAVTATKGCFHDNQLNEKINKLIASHKSVTALAATNTGNQVTPVSAKKTIKVWDLGTGKEHFYLYNAWRWYATSVVWNFKTRKRLFILTGHSGLVNAIAVTPDSKQVISGLADKTLKVWNLDSRKKLFTLTGHSDVVNAIAVTPDSKRVISGSADKTLKVWNLKTRKAELTLTGHSDVVNAIAVTPDSRRVISGSSDKTLKVWDLESGAVIASFTGESALLCCAVAPDGVTIVAGEALGRVHFLRLELNKGEMGDKGDKRDKEDKGERLVNEA